MAAISFTPSSLVQGQAAKPSKYVNPKKKQNGSVSPSASTPKQPSAPLPNVFTGAAMPSYVGGGL